MSVKKARESPAGQSKTGMRFDRVSPDMKVATSAISCLLIDDDYEEAEIFQFAIQELGIPVRLHTCTQGAEAVRKISLGEIKPDIIFLDFCMPRMDGLECLRQIKAISSARGITIIIYSSYMREALKAEMEKIGVDAFLHKASDIDELVAKLRNCFSSGFGALKKLPVEQV